MLVATRWSPITLASDTGFTDFDGFDTWLRADPVHRAGSRAGWVAQQERVVHDVITAAGHTIQLTLRQPNYSGGNRG